MNIIKNPTDILLIEEEEELWVEKEPKAGDHIKVSRGLYTHHGIFIGYNEVIHFASKDDSDDILGDNNEVISTSLDKFLRGGLLEVKEYTEDELDDLYPVNDIISYARHCLGDSGYNLIFNNCEHFTNMCTLGEHRSKQVENILGVGGKKMGLFTFLFGGKKRETVSTTYEPDKVRVAEIEAQAKLMLEKLKGENIKINTQMQKELASHLIEQEKLLMQAKIEGFNNIVDKLASLSNEMILIRIEKMKELEVAQNESEKEIIAYYDEFANRLEEKNRDFEMNHLPNLNKQRDSYEKGNASWNTYNKLINKRLERYFDEMQKEAESFRKQREKRLDSTIRIREIVELQLNEISKKTLELVEKKSKFLESNNQVLLENSKINKLQIDASIMEEKQEVLNAEVVKPEVKKEPSFDSKTIDIS